MTETPAEAWARCQGFIEAALERGDGGHLVNDVRVGVERGEFHFWPGERCAIVTEFLTSPRLKTVNFWLGGGDLREMLAMRPDIEAWALSQGCTQAIGGGLHHKRGWGRVLQAAGYRPCWIIYSKELAA